MSAQFMKREARISIIPYSQSASIGSERWLQRVLRIRWNDGRRRSGNLKSPRHWASSGHAQHPAAYSLWWWPPSSPSPTNTGSLGYQALEERQRTSLRVGRLKYRSTNKAELGQAVSTTKHKTRCPFGTAGLVCLQRHTGHTTLCFSLRISACDDVTSPS